jgi:hypothetical protein
MPAHKKHAPKTGKTAKAKAAPKRGHGAEVESCILREDSPEYDAGAPRFIDLFCGIGGFRIAFERAGGRCVFSSDYDKFSQQTYEANFGEKPHGDIHGIAVADIPAHEILCGGFPCQPFSLAGVSKKLSLGRKHGFQDEKQGNLFFSLADIIDFHRPAAFVLENLKHLVRHDKGRTFDIILRTLTDHLWNYLQRYAEKHRAAGNDFGIVTECDIAHTLSARYHKDGSEILIAQNGARNPQQLRFAKNGRAMLRKKRQLRRRGIVGKTQRLARISAEVLGDAALR